MRDEIVIRVFCGYLVVLSVTLSWLYANSAGYMLTKSPSARSSALGDTFGSIDDDVIGVKYNPGLLPRISQSQLSLMFNKGFIDDSYANVIFGLPTDYGAFAGSIDYYNAGVLEFYDSSWNKRTVTAEKDIAFGLSYGNVLTISDEPIYAGITLKYLSSTLLEYKTASAFAFDIGSFYSFSNVMTGFSLQNIGTKLKYINTGDSLPSSVRISGCYQGKDFFVISDANYIFTDKIIIPSIGIEYLVKEIIALRAGYKFNSDVEGLAFGFGTRLKNFGLNYSFGLNQIFSNSHIISIDIFLPEVKKKKQSETQTKTSYISVKVTDTKGNPLPNATIIILWEGQEMLIGLTNEDGRYSSDNLLLDKYTVKVWKQGYIAEEKKVKVSADNPTEINFSLKKK